MNITDELKAKLLSAESAGKSASLKNRRSGDRNLTV